MEIAERLRSHCASRGSSSQDLSLFFFFWCFLSLRSEPSTHKENRSVWEEEDRGRQSCDRSVLSL